MCLAIPGQLTERFEQDGLPMGRVDFNGTRRVICLAYVPGVQIGDYVLVHVGFALSRLDPDEAERTLMMIDELGALNELDEPGEEQPI